VSASIDGLHTPSLLFCPADRPDRYAKALAVADVVVLDLEDAVSPANKQQARIHLVENPINVDRTVVRVNPVSSLEHEADLAAVRATSYRTVMLAKSEEPAELEAFMSWRVIALCETPRGVINAGPIAALPNTVALMWGAEDLVAAMGGRSSRHTTGSYRDFAVHARSTVLLAAKAYGRQAIDAVYIDFADPDGLAAEAEDAAATGFDLKACIHPSQCDIVRKAYLPTAREIEWAEAVIAASVTEGVTQLDGQMIDHPLIVQAQQILARALPR
jgi:citrate lyase subunit beta/citryl-CoA lyase